MIELSSGWVLYALSCSALVSAAAVGLARATRTAGLPGRWIWLGAMALCLALPLSPFAWGEGTPAGRAGPHSADAPAATGIPQGALALPVSRGRGVGLGTGLAGTAHATVRATGTLITGALHALDRRLPSAGGSLVVGIWLGGSAAAGLLLLASQFHQVRRQRRWPRVRIHGHAILVGPTTDPAAVGAAWPRIVMPPWALGLPSEDLKLILAHEEAHCRARDPLLLLVGAVLCAATWWNPFVWWQFSRLRASVELDCDRRVLAGGVTPRVYARVLVDIATRNPRSVPIALAPGWSAGVSVLERRLHAMKNRNTPVSLSRKGTAATAVALAGALVLVACEIEPPLTSVDTERAPEATAELETGAVAPRPLGPLLVVNGVVAGPAGADLQERMPAAAVRSIEVVKGAAAASEYGAQARHGVILVDAPSFEVEDLAPPRAPRAPADRGAGTVEPDAPGAPVPDMEARSVTPSEARTTGGQPLFVVNGVTLSLTRSEFDEQIPAAAIRSIEVVKGAAAISRFGSAARDGVIIITAPGVDADRIGGS